MKRCDIVVSGLNRGDDHDSREWTTASREHAEHQDVEDDARACGGAGSEEAQQGSQRLTMGRTAQGAVRLFFMLYPTVFQEQLRGGDQHIGHSQKRTYRTVHTLSFLLDRYFFQLSS